MFLTIQRRWSGQVEQLLWEPSLPWAGFKCTIRGESTASGKKWPKNCKGAPLNKAPQLLNCGAWPWSRTHQFRSQQYTQENREHGPYRNWCMNAHRTIHNSPKAKTTQASINWWMNPYNMLQPYHGIFFGNKKEWCTDVCYDMDETSWQVKEARHKGQILNDSTYMKCLAQANA